VLEVLEAVAQDALGNIAEDLYLSVAQDRQSLFDDLVARGQNLIAGDLASLGKVKGTRAPIRKMLPALHQSFSGQAIYQAYSCCMG